MLPLIQNKFSDINYICLISIDLDRQELIQDVVVFCQIVSMVRYSIYSK